MLYFFHLMEWEQSLKHLDTGNYDDNFNKVIVHYPFTTSNNKEAFLQDFLEILEEMLPQVQIFNLTLS